MIPILAKQHGAVNRKMQIAVDLFYSVVYYQCMAELKTVQIDKDLYAKLSKRKRETGVSITRQIADAVREWLKKVAA